MTETPVDTVAESLSSILGIPVNTVSMELPRGWSWAEAIENLEPMALGVDKGCFQWSNLIDIPDGPRLQDVEDEENLSDLMFGSVDKAKVWIDEETYGWGSDDAKDFTLIRVCNFVVPNPFSKP